MTSGTRRYDATTEPEDFEERNAGVPEGWRVELIDGETHVSPPPDGCHGETVAEVARGITLGAVDTRLRVYTGVGLRIPGRGRPDRFIPDVVVAPKGSFATSAEYHAPDAVVLVGEVTSSSTADRDRGPKRRGYARAGTPAYLLVDLTTAETILLSEPVGDEYRTHRRVPLAASLRLPPPLDFTLDTADF
ncbi:Uma2 family endonuclease [Streptomyces alkaliphilus]|uniref:Uma2 family endonuclease n=1 Tax=Streptomyces alkaliphilus TaxID=1472722 RepID=UPI002B1EC33D|nr:Uma2 family endonuclease [Streptomyces alkaliphilus]